MDLQIQLEFTVQWFGSHCHSNRCLSCPMTHSFKLFHTLIFYCKERILSLPGKLWSVVRKKTEEVHAFLLSSCFAPTPSSLPHCAENPIYAFPEMKLRGLFPNSYIPVSDSDLYIPRIGHRYINVEIGKQNIIILFWK